jgi:hypothetical protein
MSFRLRYASVRALILAVVLVSLTPGAGSAADPAPAAFGVVYATLGNNASSPGALITIDPATGAGTLVGPTGIVGSLNDPGVPALAIRSTGEILAMDIGTGSRLYWIDATTGAATLVATTALASPPAIAYDGGDILWAVDNVGKLYTLDDQTGASVLVGATGAFIKGMAFDPTTGVLWGSDASSAVFTINVQTGAATLVGSTGLAPSPDIYFDAAGTLYGASGGGFNINNLITVDKVSGAGLVVGSIGFASVAGMATRHDRFVPVAVQAHDASWIDGHVVVTWRLIDMQGAISFEMLRADGSGPFTRIDGAGVVEARGEFMFVDDATEPDMVYRYRVAIFEDGDLITSFEESVSTPSVTVSLEQNQPNPFNPATRISFAIGETGHVSLGIYDSAGRSVRTLVDRELLPGSFTETWDGRDGGGRSVASGVYFYRLETGKLVLTRKAVLVK